MPLPPLYGEDRTLAASAHTPRVLPLFKSTTQPEADELRRKRAFTTVGRQDGASLPVGASTGITPGRQRRHIVKPARLREAEQQPWAPRRAAPLSRLPPLHRDEPGPAAAVTAFLVEGRHALERVDCNSWDSCDLIARFSPQGGERAQDGRAYAFAKAERLDSGKRRRVDLFVASGAENDEGEMTAEQAASLLAQLGSCGCVR